LSLEARGDLPQILRAGKVLVLLDGLDEVTDADSSWVLKTTIAAILQCQ
jgi:predicted NACHT family NTPase